MKRQISLISCVALLAFFGVLGSNPVAAQTAPTKPLTIETMYQPGGLTGRAPETLEWSPDGTRLTFVQRDEKGEKGEKGGAQGGSGAAPAANKAGGAGKK